MRHPTTKSRVLRDGFYIELRSKNSKGSLKIRRDTKEQMLRAIKTYERSKEVIPLGEIKNGKIIQNKISN